MRRIICVFFVLCLILSLCGCRSSDNNNSSSDYTETVTESKNFTASLLYSYSDSFNPYSATTQINRQLCKLLFDPLIKLDNNFEVVYCLAQSAEISGKSCKVVLKDISFSDGTKVTANDVAYSFNLARSSATVYASQLYEVSSVSVANNLTVIFNLTRVDPYFINLLDFPIIKSGSVGVTNSDGVAVPPIGCGRYTINSDKTKLIFNDLYYGNKGQIKTINLINSPDSESLSHHIEVGAASIYYTDLSDGNIVRMSGKKTEINLNSLVYIGINSSYGDLAGKNMRYAISSALNRTDICQQAFYNSAKPATGFLNPELKAVNHVQSIDKKSNMQITVENLSEIGYNSLDGNGFRVNETGKHPVYSLLVNSDNKSKLSCANIIASQLKSAGIQINVTAKPYDSYIADLQSGNFELYLGEINILNNMDISPLVVAGGSAAYGVGLEPPALDENGNAVQNNVSACQTVINEYYSGNGSVSISDVAGAVLTEMPQIPICFKLGLLFYNSNISSGVSASQSDIYFSIESYVCNIKDGKN